MDHVQIVVVHLDEPIVDRHVGSIEGVLRCRLTEFDDRRAVPVLALLPCIPGAIRVEAVQHVRPEADRRVEVVLHHIVDAREDVLRHDPCRVPAYREDRMEPRVGVLEHEMDGQVVRGVNARDLGREGATPGHCRIRHLSFDGVDDVVRVELLAVTPVDAVTKIYCHLAEIGVVLGRACRQRVLNHTVDAGIGVDVPERVHHQLMETRRPSSTNTTHPDVEPGGIAQKRFGILKDQRLLTRQILTG